MALIPMLASILVSFKVVDANVGDVQKALELIFTGIVTIVTGAIYILSRTSLKKEALKYAPDVTEQGKTEATVQG